MSASYSKNSIGVLSTLNLIVLMSVETCAVLIDAVALPLLNLIDAFPAVDVSIITIRSSHVSARYCSLLTVDTLAVPVSSSIP
jgi:hypothetical protein